MIYYITLVIVCMAQLLILIELKLALGWLSSTAVEPMGLALVLRSIANPELADRHDLHLLLETGEGLRGAVPRHERLVHRLAMLCTGLEDHATFDAPAFVGRLIAARHRLVELVHELATGLGARLDQVVLLEGHIGRILGDCPSHGRCGALQHQLVLSAAAEHAWSVVVVGRA